MKMRILPKILLALTAALLLALGYAHFIEPERLVVRRVDLRTDKWPAGAPGLRILQLSDLHYHSMSARLRDKLVQAAAVEKSDLIVITGDFFIHSDVLEPGRKVNLEQELEGISAFLSRLQAPLGVWAVRGNHNIADDEESGDSLVNQLSEEGIQFLTNQHASLDYQGVPFHLIGLDYSLDDIGGASRSRVIQRGEERFLRLGAAIKDSYTHYYPIENVLPAPAHQLRNVNDHPGHGALPEKAARNNEGTSNQPAAKEFNSPRAWRNYTLSVYIRLSQIETSGIGLTFCSQLHKGLDHYYRLRWTASEGLFRFSPHNTLITHGQAELPVRMTPGCWYRCKVEVKTGEKETRIAGKLWEEGTHEPAAWKAVAMDSSSRRLTVGSIGCWSIYEGKHDFGDLLVVDEKGVTLLCETWKGGGAARQNLAHSGRSAGSSGTPEQGERPLSNRPDGWVDIHRNGGLLPRLAAAVPQQELRILLSHHPRLAEAAATVGIDLMLSGHNYGGQICLPFIGPAYPFSDRTKILESGLYHVKGMPLYISPGLGTIYFRLRFLAPRS